MNDKWVKVGRDSSVSIATHYRLDGLKIESRWDTRFSTSVQTSPGAHSASYEMVTGSVFRGLKRPGHGVNHPPSFSSEIKERVKLYLYSLSGRSWPVLGRTLPLTFKRVKIKKQ